MTLTHCDDCGMPHAKCECDYCIDCSNPIDQCACYHGEEEMNIVRTPVDEFISQTWSKQTKDSWDEFFDPKEDRLEFERAAYNIDMAQGKTGKEKLSTTFGFVDDNSFNEDGTIHTQCEHCATIFLTLEEDTKPMCPCCHKITKIVKPSCKHIKEVT